MKDDLAPRSIADMPPPDTKSIAIMLHERDRRGPNENYRIWPIAENWRRAGIEVQVVHGPKPCLDADVLVPHIDCTIVPDAYWEVIQQHPRVVNARLRDISKTAFSEHLVSVDDAYAGAVIVKTNRNSGGFKDLDFGQTRPQSLGDQLRKRLAWHPWLAKRSLGWAHTLKQYPIFEHIAQVPTGVWDNPHLVVEKFFTPDCDAQGDHVLHLWIVMGDASLGLTLHSPDPLVKSANARLGTFEQPPPEILAAQERLGCDYAKIDYILHKGRPILLDINRTPTLSNNAFTQHYINQTKDLAQGIASIRPH
ncbi:MAG: hypothetical protein HOH58_04670 [Opitutaceae bacterium]|nr:hypothetical protein [Opitutaceae bacterium]